MFVPYTQALCCCRAAASPPLPLLPLQDGMSTARDSGDGEATAGVRAAVVGAGITGLFTALRLAEVGCSVTVFSDHKDTQTMTSLAAGAVWFPYELGETPTEVVQQVSVRTAEWGLQVVADGLGDTAGVAVMPATQLFGTVEEAAAACRAYQFTTVRRGAAVELRWALTVRACVRVCDMFVCVCVRCRRLDRAACFLRRSCLTTSRASAPASRTRC